MTPQAHGDPAVNLCLLWDLDLYGLIVPLFVCMFNCGKGSGVHGALSIHQPSCGCAGRGTMVGVSVLTHWGPRCQSLDWVMWVDGGGSDGSGIETANDQSVKSPK